MTNFEILDDLQSEHLSGGNGRGANFSYINATTDISNVALQENRASNWASAAGAIGSSSPWKRHNGGGGEVEAKTGSIVQGNLNYFTPFALTLAFG
jgi:hypothetical protein